MTKFPCRRWGQFLLVGLCVTSCSVAPAAQTAASAGAQQGEFRVLAGDLDPLAREPCRCSVTVAGTFTEGADNWSVELDAGGSRQDSEGFGRVVFKSATEGTRRYRFNRVLCSADTATLMLVDKNNEPVHSLLVYEPLRQIQLSDNTTGGWVMFDPVTVTGTVDVTLLDPCRR